MRTDILERKDEILQWIEQNQSKAFICEQLHCKPETLNKYLLQMDIIYTGNQGSKGKEKPSTQYIPLDEYLNTSTDIQSNKVRQKLLREGYKEAKCECCGLTEWLGKPIPLELHHKDGNRYNNTLDNYALLCPNCHAQTETYRGKNSKK